MMNNAFIFVKMINQYSPGMVINFKYKYYV